MIPTSDLRLLVIDAYDAAGRDGLDRAGATRAGLLYDRMLTRLVPDARLDHISFAHADPHPPEPLDTYHGVLWTGSSLTLYHDTPITRTQIALARATFQAGVPTFGSCYGAQLAVTAAGGQVAANPRGREFGLARKITLTAEGRDHPMYAGKPIAFDAFTCHSDMVTQLPPGATLLAGNTFTPVQAVSVFHANGHFWAPQYHPEYDLHEIARLAVARGASLLAQGAFADQSSLNRYAADLETLHASPQPHIAFTYGIDDDVTDFDARTREVRNWLQHLTHQA